VVVGDVVDEVKLVTAGVVLVDVKGEWSNMKWWELVVELEVGGGKVKLDGDDDEDEMGDDDIEDEEVIEGNRWVSNRFSKVLSSGGVICSSLEMKGIAVTLLTSSATTVKFMAKR
jgi:hypothetical protein